MDAETIRARQRELVAKHGPWINHNIELAPGVFTIGPHVKDHPKLRRVLQLVHDLAGGPPAGLRVLDLASLEGQYAVEMARRGASVVAIEGRDGNLEKMQLTRDALGLDAIRIVRDDVRNLSREKYGEFDVVLCLGILYHIDAPDVFRFVERVFEVCRRFAIIDTHIALEARERYEWRGETYWGAPYVEHAPEATEEQKAKSMLASLDNPRSAWFTRPSLCNLLSRTGFSSVAECHVPSWDRRADRICLAAIKGTRVRISCMPDGGAETPVEAEEPPHPAPAPREPGPLRRVARTLPTPVKSLVKRLIR